VKFGVSSYSFLFTCGYARQANRHVARPLGVYDLIDLAAEHGLSHMAIPLGTMLPDLSDDTIDQLRARLADAGLDLVVDTGVIDVENLRQILPAARRAGAGVVRGTLSTILEGARAALPGGWPVYLDEMCRRILQLRPLLEELDLILAIENHQDATSDDLLDLCEAGGPHVGVTLDVANPLAVAYVRFRLCVLLG
jgi:sugar phosphate isomerase/epimerase